jgi:hypothetical protein
MSSLPRDENRIPVIGGVSPIDGATPVSIYGDDTTHELYVKSITTIPVGTVSATGITGAPVTVGTTAVEMTFTGTTKVIAIKAASTNTGLIWFGPATVDSTGTGAYGELTADSSVEIELNDAAAPIYCCASVAGQKVYKAALT